MSIIVAGRSTATRPAGAGRSLRWLLLLVAVSVWSSAGLAGTDGDLDLTELEIEDLLGFRVTSVSKKSQSLGQAPAAIFVITREDIRRSGVTTIPEALRMAPGIQVASIDGNKWAITSRGFNDRFANKLLVLMDGRSVYTPLFSGVFWDVQDTMLDNIDRIEVIRGPGAVLWGANAVNGVINIITLPAEETQGGMLVALAGSKERGAGVRYGGPVGESGHYRAYVKGFDRDESGLYPTGQDANDDWRVARAGFRLDWRESDKKDFTLQGDIYNGDGDEYTRTFIDAPPSNQIVSAEQDFDGGNVLFRWVRGRGSDNELALQGYYDRTDRESSLFDEKRDTFDVELDQRIVVNRKHDLVWGVGFRQTRDELAGGLSTRTTEDKRNDSLYSAFLQDEITLVPSRLSLILGAKFEHNDYTGFEIQPNVRIMWTDEQQHHSLWGSVTRAVRTPSRFEHTTGIFGLFGPGVLPPGTPENPFPLPLVTALIGNDEFDSEELVAYEVGYRVRLHPRASLDVATFYNDYDDLISTAAGMPYCEPSGAPIDALPPCFFTDSYVVAPLTFQNDIQAETYGIEISADVHNLPRWRLQASYSHLESSLTFPDDHSSIREDLIRSPEDQVSLRSWTALGTSVDLDLWLRYVGPLPTIGVDSYFTADARLGWKLKDNVELSLVGQNLIDDDRLEYVGLLGDVSPTQVSASWYLRLSWNF